jgi:hypothetical protein
MAVVGKIALFKQRRHVLEERCALAPKTEPPVLTGYECGWAVTPVDTFW